MRALTVCELNRGVGALIIDRNAKPGAFRGFILSDVCVQYCNQGAAPWPLQWLQDKMDEEFPV